jgi:hypothetical protein
MNWKRFIVCYVAALATGVCFFVAGSVAAVIGVAVPVSSVFIAMMLYVDNTPIKIRKDEE